MNLEGTILSLLIEPKGVASESEVSGVPDPLGVFDSLGDSLGRYPISR